MTCCTCNAAAEVRTCRPRPARARRAATTSTGITGVGFLKGCFTGPWRSSSKEPQKATIEKLEQQLHGDREPRCESDEAHGVLVSGVRAGKIDTEKLAALDTEKGKALSSRQQNEVEALNGLYAALDPSQRTALIGL